MTDETFRRPSRLERTKEERKERRGARRRLFACLALALILLLCFSVAIGLVIWRMEESTRYFSRNFPYIWERFPTFLADCLQTMDKTQGFR